MNYDGFMLCLCRQKTSIIQIGLQKMYKKSTNQASMMNLPLFLNGTLKETNRWVKLAALIPWDVIEDIYAKNFTSHTGGKALPARMALGALLIQVKLNLTDDETVNQIVENPYLQYFIGLEAFQETPPFDGSTMTNFRKRLNINDIKEIDEHIYRFHNASNDQQVKTKKNKKGDDDSNSDSNSPQNLNDETDPKTDVKTKENRGELIVDASCAPADIHFPTDLHLLNKAREKSELIVDTLWKHRNNPEEKIKPRTYRKKGRKAFVSILKQKRPGKKKIRTAINIQLCCLRRNFEIIDQLKLNSSLINLGNTLYGDLLVIQTLYSQQQEMYSAKKRSIADRIVSISQPHVRPIVRGKAGAKVEFGAKFSISVIDGWNFLDTVSFDAYNESTELIDQIEKFKKRTGVYPASVHADQIYRNKKNRSYCDDKGIRLSGPKLGRPTKDEEKLKAQKELEYADEGARNIVEGRFGIGKRRYGLDKIMTKLKATSETSIALIFMMMNLDKLIHFLVSFLWRTRLSNWKITTVIRHTLSRLGYFQSVIA